MEKEIRRKKKRVAQKFVVKFTIEVKAPSVLVRELIEKGIGIAMKDIKRLEGYERKTKIDIKVDGDLIGSL